MCESTFISEQRQVSKKNCLSKNGKREEKITEARREIFSMKFLFYFICEERIQRNLIYAANVCKEKYKWTFMQCGYVGLCQFK